MNKHEIAINAIEAKSEQLIDLAQKMWDEPETAYNEVKAAQWTAEVQKANGFEVEMGAYNLPTGGAEFRFALDMEENNDVEQ